MKISVLIPTRDRPAMLHRTLISIWGQTHKDLEVLVGLDAAIAETRKTVRLFPDPRVRSYDFPQHRGPYRVYEDLFARARGEAIIFFSDDDLMADTFLERCATALADPDIAYVRTGWWLWDGKDGLKINPTGWGAFNSTVYRRSTLEVFIAQYGHIFDPALRFYGDATFYGRLADLVPSGRVARIDEPLIYYREHPGQLSRNPPMHAVLEYARSRRIEGKPVRFRDLPAYMAWTFKRRVERMVRRY